MAGWPGCSAWRGAWGSAPSKCQFRTMPGPRLGGAQGGFAASSRLCLRNPLQVMIVCMSGICGEGPKGAIKAKCEQQAGKKLRDGLFLDWRPMARDAIFYIASLVIVVIFALTSVGDGHRNPAHNGKSGFVWWEGLVLSLCYLFYIQV